MGPGSVIVTPSLAHSVYDADGKLDASATYKPDDKARCYVSVVLGTIRKGEDPTAFAMDALKALGWTPPNSSIEPGRTPTPKDEVLP